LILFLKKKTLAGGIFYDKKRKAVRHRLFLYRLLLSDVSKVIHREFSSY